MSQNAAFTRDVLLALLFMALILGMDFYFLGGIPSDGLTPMLCLSVAASVPIRDLQRRLDAQRERIRRLEEEVKSWRETSNPRAEIQRQVE